MGRIQEGIGNESTEESGNELGKNYEGNGKVRKAPILFLASFYSQIPHSTFLFL